MKFGSCDPVVKEFIIYQVRRLRSEVYYDLDSRERSRVLCKVHINKSKVAIDFIIMISTRTT
jgi:hypothetical protein